MKRIITDIARGLKGTQSQLGNKLNIMTNSDASFERSNNRVSMDSPLQTREIMTRANLIDTKPSNNVGSGQSKFVHLDEDMDITAEYLMYCRAVALSVKDQDNKLLGNVVMHYDGSDETKFAEMVKKEINDSLEKGIKYEDLQFEIVGVQVGAYLNPPFKDKAGMDLLMSDVLDKIQPNLSEKYDEIKKESSYQSQENRNDLTRQSVNMAEDVSSGIFANFANKVVNKVSASCSQFYDRVKDTAAARHAVFSFREGGTVVESVAITPHLAERLKEDLRDVSIEGTIVKTGGNSSAKSAIDNMDTSGLRGARVESHNGDSQSTASAPNVACPDDDRTKGGGISF